MNPTSRPSDDGSSPVDIIAFKLHNQDFCLETTGIREIRGRGKSTPIPHAPPYVLGVMDLRGTVIPIFDLAVKLGMEPADNSERSAIVVADVNGGIVGLVVDGVSDLLTINRSDVQPLPRGSAFAEVDYAHGIITHDLGMICFLDLDHLFTHEANSYRVAA